MDKQILLGYVYKWSVEDIKDEWLQPSKGHLWYKHITGLPSKLKATYLISVLLQQVLNGGLHQYFINGYGQFVYDTIFVAKEINATAVSSILERAIRNLDPSLYSEEEFRSKLLLGELEVLYSDEVLEKQLESLDSEFLDVASNLEDILGSHLIEEI